MEQAVSTIVKQQPMAGMGQDGGTDPAAMTLNNRARCLYLQVENIRDRLRGEGSKEVDFDLTTLNAVLDCIWSTFEMACNAMDQLRILGSEAAADKDPGPPKGPDTVYQSACLLAAKLSDMHMYLSGGMPEFQPEPDQSCIVDKILYKMAYSENLTKRIRHALDEIIG